MLTALSVFIGIGIFVLIIILRTKQQEKQCGELRRRFEESGDLSSRASLTRQALRTAVKTYNPSREGMGLKMLADCFWEQGHFHKAENLYASALTALYLENGLQDKDVRTCIERLTKIYQDLGRADRLKALQSLHTRVETGIGLGPKALAIEGQAKTGPLPPEANWYQKSCYAVNQIVPCFFKKDKWPLAPQGIACGDYRWKATSLISTLGHFYKKTVHDHEKITMFPYNGRYAFLASFAFLIGFIALFFLVGTLLYGPTTYAAKKMYWIIGPMAVLSLCLYLASRMVEKSKITLERRTGMVTFCHLDRVVPFREMEAEINKKFQLNGKVGGTTYWQLDVFHPQDKRLSLAVLQGNIRATYEMARSEWEFLQQFMAVNCPLPDIPELEPYRSSDPTTSAYDQEMKRSPQFWRDMESAQLQDETIESTLINKHFPWPRAVRRIITASCRPS